MPSFFSFLISHRFPNGDNRRRIFARPLTRAGALFYGLLIASAVLLYCLIISINDTFLVSVPARGGSITEGIVGAPHFINPLLAVTDTDRSLVSLVYGGLFKHAATGDIVPELATKYVISPDGMTYTVTLDPSASWSTGKPVTTEDVAFTVTEMQDATINPNLASYWQSVTIETSDERTISFTLPAPDLGFPDRLTFGVMPKVLWEETPNELIGSSELNATPVGAGAFAINHIEYKDNIPVSIHLVRNARYVSGKPLVRRLTIDIFANQQALATALANGSIDYTYALAPDTLADIALPDGFIARAIPTETQYGLYRLPSDTMLASGTLISILDRSIDRTKIISIVEHGYGTIGSTSASALSPEEAQQALQTAGYRIQQGTLYKGSTLVGLSIATENDPTLLTLARTIAGELEQLGMIVSVKAFDPGTFREQVQNGGYSVILAGAHEQQLARYQDILDLYTENTPLVTREPIGLPSYTVLASPLWRYTDISAWYARTDELWRWLAPKTTNNF